MGKPRCKAFVNEPTHTHKCYCNTRTHFGISSSKGKLEGSGTDSKAHLSADFRASYINDLFQFTLTPPPSFTSMLPHHLPDLITWEGNQEPTWRDTPAFGPAHSAQLRDLLFKHLGLQNTTNTGNFRSKHNQCSSPKHPFLPHGL